MKPLMIKTRLVAALTMLLMLTGAAVTPALARTPYYGGYGSPYNGYVNRYNGGSFSYNHPYVTKAAVVGGAGALIGGLIAPEGDKGSGAVKGALLGAGLGVGYQFLRDRGYMNGFHF